MSNTVKPSSDRDYQQTLKLSFNDSDDSLSTAGFLVGKVGREIRPTVMTTTILNDTVEYSYLEDSVELYAIKTIYTNGSRTDLISAKRVR